MTAAQDIVAALPGAAGRQDPVETLVRQGQGRIPDLLPLRYGRMLADEFAFYRGAAAVMAHDLATTADSGIETQVCGDAHLSNFGAFASPERRLLFDINDFDETTRGPFEWDCKRLATSFDIAARSLDLTESQRHTAVREVAATYADAMADFATRDPLAVWYSRMDLKRTLKAYRAELKPKVARHTEKVIAKATSRDGMSALAKLARIEDGLPRLISNPPLVETLDDLAGHLDREEALAWLGELLRDSAPSLSHDRRVLLGRYRLIDAARKVVGVGSVGTRCWILLLVGPRPQDLLLMQAKEACPSVVDVARGVDRPGHAGERVVNGQRLMQAASDPLLAYQSGPDVGGVSHDYYLRQLRDWKASYEVEKMTAAGLHTYARMCGWTLARAHARAGDPVAIDAFVNDHGPAGFADALYAFAEGYADLNAADYGTLASAVAAGRVEAATG